MSTVLIFDWKREDYRPIIIEKDELYLSPYSGNIQHPMNKAHAVDVAELLGKQKAPYHDPDLIVCKYGCPGLVIPHNLKGLRGKKVLILGDLHHGEMPLSKGLQVAMMEPWDMVLIMYTRQHCHFFRDAGIKNVAWIPCFLLNPINMEPKTIPSNRIVFVGGLSPIIHPRRMKFLMELRKHVPELELINASIQDTAKIHNSAFISLNYDLNGDWNNRNFEVMASGGCLMSHALPFLAYDSNWGHDSNIFSDVRQCIDRIKELISYVESRNKKAKLNYDWFWKNYSPSHMIQRFHEALNGAITWKDTRIGIKDNIQLRVNAYDLHQELARRGEESRISDLTD